MLGPVRIKSIIAPKKFENLGNGNWYYNYDITAESIDDLNTIWSYIQIKLSSKPEYKKCVELIIRKHITSSQEFDLINSANRVLLNNRTELPVEYLDYLNLIDEIKSKVKSDFGM